MKKKTLYYIIGALALLIIVLLILKHAGVIGKNDATKVSVDKVAYRNITETVSASGTVYPEVEVKVSSDVSGEITDLPVKEGDSVTKGQVVAKIYADVYSSIAQMAEAQVSQMQAQLANATDALGSYKAKLDQAKATYDRDKKLLAQKVISQSEFEQDESAYFSAESDYNAAKQQIKSAEFGVKNAKASLSQAEDNLNRTTITAPMSGIISVLDVKKGERVVGTAQMTGTEIMRIADMSVMEVRVDVGENDIPKVNYGDTAIIEIDAYNNRKFTGIVTQIAPSSDAAASQTSTTSSSTSSAEEVTNYDVHIRILRSSYEDLFDPKHPRNLPLRPGMSASVNIETQTHDHVLSVPINAVTTRDNLTNNTINQNNTNNADTSTSSSGTVNEVVFVVRKDNTVKLQKVTTDIQDDNYIEVTSGLKEGQEVVTAPYSAVSRTLTDSAAVKVVPQSQLFNLQQ
jgi:HlyD family secretion protein